MFQQDILIDMIQHISYNQLHMNYNDTCFYKQHILQDMEDIHLLLYNILVDSQDHIWFHPINIQMYNHYNLYYLCINHSLKGKEYIHDWCFWMFFQDKHIYDHLRQMDFYKYHSDQKFLNKFNTLLNIFCNKEFQQLQPRLYWMDKYKIHQNFEFKN